MLSVTQDETYSIDFSESDDSYMSHYLNGYTYGLTSTQVDPLFVIAQPQPFKSGFLDGFSKRINYSIPF